MNPEAREIQLMIAHHFDMTRKQLLKGGRARSIVKARQIAMAMCRFLTDMSFPEIATAFGGFDHSTVVSAVKRVRCYLDADDPVTTRAVLYVREQYCSRSVHPELNDGDDAFIHHCVALGVRAVDVTAPKQQCNECPWSQAAPRGLFSPARFEALRTTEEAAGALFACHKSVDGADVPCAGWLEHQRGPHGHNIRVRLCFSKRSYRPPALNGEQFNTYEEMESAHVAAWFDTKGVFAMSAADLNARDIGRLVSAVRTARSRHEGSIIPPFSELGAALSSALKREGDLFENLAEVLAVPALRVRKSFDLVKEALAEKHGPAYTEDVWKRFMKKDGE